MLLAPAATMAICTYMYIMAFANIHCQYKGLHFSKECPTNSTLNVCLLFTVSSEI